MGTQNWVNSTTSSVCNIQLCCIAEHLHALLALLALMLTQQVSAVGDFSSMSGQAIWHAEALLMGLCESL